MGSNVWDLHKVGYQRNHRWCDTEKADAERVMRGLMHTRSVFWRPGDVFYNTLSHAICRVVEVQVRMIGCIDDVLITIEYANGYVYRNDLGAYSRHVREGLFVPVFVVSNETEGTVTDARGRGGCDYV